MTSLPDFFRIAPGFLFAVILAGNSFGQQKNAGDPVNDAVIRAKFQKGLEKLEGFSGVSTADLQKQLKERRECQLELARPRAEAPRLSPSEIYQQARKATLVFGHLFKCEKCTKWHPNLAGGVVIDPSGIAVTNYHVMDKPDAGIFGAMTADGEIAPVVEVLAASRKDDLAIVRLSGGPFEAVPVSVGDAVGAEVKVISHPDGRFYSFSEGAISRYYIEPKNKTPRLQITADYARGSSGCGVFNEAGQLTGVVASTNSIYYTETKGEQNNLQMVVKSCIPAFSIRKMAGSEKGAEKGQSE